MPINGADLAKMTDEEIRNRFPKFEKNCDSCEEPITEEDIRKYTLLNKSYCPGCFNEVSTDMEENYGYWATSEDRIKISHSLILR